MGASLSDFRDMPQPVALSKEEKEAQRLLNVASRLEYEFNMLACKDADEEEEEEDDDMGFGLFD